MSKNVVVVAESRNGNLRNVSFEVLTAAQTIANGGHVTAVVFGEASEEQVQQLAQHGADTVQIAEHADLASYSTDG